jgi:hypothetical protein
MIWIAATIAVLCFARAFWLAAEIATERRDSNRRHR